MNTLYLNQIWKKHFQYKAVDSNTISKIGFFKTQLHWNSKLFIFQAKVLLTMLELQFKSGKKVFSGGWSLSMWCGKEMVPVAVVHGTLLIATCFFCYVSSASLYTTFTIQ